MFSNVVTICRPAPDGSPPAIAFAPGVEGIFARGVTQRHFAGDLDQESRVRGLRRPGRAPAGSRTVFLPGTPQRAEVLRRRKIDGPFEFFFELRGLDFHRRIFAAFGQKFSPGFSCSSSPASLAARLPGILGVNSRASSHPGSDTWLNSS